MTENDFAIDFIGIGAAKSGTTWLAKALSAHPGICFSSVKGTKFFYRTLQKGRNEFLRYDGSNIGDYGFFFKSCGPGKLRGEFSAGYMREPRAAEDIQRHFPDVKIIAILREPVSRFISHYHFRRFNQKGDQSPIESEISRDSELGYAGMYADHLRPFFDRFPREHIYILIYEEVMAQPQVALRDLYRFLGVDDSYIPHEVIGVRVNKGGKVRFAFIMYALEAVHRLMIRLGIAWLVGGATRRRLQAFVERLNFTRHEAEPVDGETRRRIRALYSEDRMKLEALIDRDLTPFWGRA